MHTACPNCYMENAYHNSFGYECPDCDYEWSNDVDSSINVDDDDDDSIFDEFTQRPNPFFKLEHGALYDCKIDFIGKIEELSIIPLAFKHGENKQFILINAKKLLKTNPLHVQKLIAMDFETISNDGISDDEMGMSSAMTILCTTIDTERILDHTETLFFDFKKRHV